MNSSGLISGTSTSTSGGGKELTIRATDSGGNYLDLNTVLPYAIATGGTIQTQGSTLFHTFASSGTYTQLVTAPVSYINVGGGGRGASNLGGSGVGGGGGGGGVRDATSKSMSAGAYAVVIGGAQTASTFDSLTAGAGSNSSQNAAGGTSGSPQSRSGFASGGGGGAGAVAFDGTGGLGYVSPSIQRSGVYSALYQYGAGGNGGGWVAAGGGLSGPGTVPPPSTGPYTGYTVGGTGEANSGGGGGIAASSNSGNGGSGCVIVRY